MVGVNSAPWRSISEVCGTELAIPAASACAVPAIDALTVSFGLSFGIWRTSNRIEPDVSPTRPMVFG